ncbi:MAG: putative secreted hydrolase, partial [Rhodothermales bacterium]
MRTIVLLQLLTCALLTAQELTPEGYRIATPQPSFSLPHDHGSHPGFRIEWWYITGKLRDEEERSFGFQATFFRYALKPGT